MIFVYDIYMGGAHGVINVAHFLYSLETGGQLNDIKLPVNNPEEPGLIELLRQKLTNEDMGEDDYFYFDGIRLTDNFSVRDGEIIFTYNQYEIAAYAYGPVEVFFPSKSLPPLPTSLRVIPRA